MENDSYDFETEPEKRPSFLTWLCILTFIGSGWAIINCIWTYSMANNPNFIFRERVRMHEDTLSKNDTASFNKMHERKSPIPPGIKKSLSKLVDPGNMRRIAIGGLLASLLTLAGAILMWKLIKAGFYFYVFGILFGFIIPFYVYGNDFLAVGATSFANFFGLIFIALYSLNLKSMHR